MADKSGLQLLPETRKKIEVRTPGENRLIVIGFVIATIVGGLYFGILTYVGTLEQKVADIDVQIRALEEQRDKKVEANLLSLSRQALIIGDILNNHIFITQAIQKLEERVKPDIRLDSVEISPQKQTISFEAEAGSYLLLAKQIVSFYMDDGILDVEIGKLQPSEGSNVKTSFSLKLDAEKFFKKK